MGIACDTLLITALTNCGMIAILAATGSYALIWFAWAVTIMLIAAIAYVMIRSRMSLAQVAGRLDDDNQTHDLIATAWSLRDQNDVWANQIQRLAEARITTLQYPSRSGRYGFRQHVAAWMMLACVMIAIPLLSTDKPIELANTDGAGVRMNRETDQQQTGSAIRSHPTGETDITLPGTIDPAQPVRGATQSPNDPSTQSPGDASGGGKADSHQVQPIDPSTPTGGIASPGPTDQVFTGSGMGAERTSATDGAGKTMQTTEKAGIPPWKSNQWSAQQQAARDALQSGKIPSSQRDLVRAYFDR